VIVVLDPLRVHPRTVVLSSDLRLTTEDTNRIAGAEPRESRAVSTRAAALEQTPAVAREGRSGCCRLSRQGAGPGCSVRLVAADPITDIAVLQAGRSGPPVARFATALPQVGQSVITVGSPLGFTKTVSAGIVSGLGRAIPGAAAAGNQALVDLIQTDAAISPDNSGALADFTGAVIGISEAYISPQAGAVDLGFAIPAATALEVAEELRTGGRARHAFTGLPTAPASPPAPSSPSSPTSRHRRSKRSTAPCADSSRVRRWP
jgi:hypothetical protein